jgi:hypothetical protein
VLILGRFTEDRKPGNQLARAHLRYSTCAAISPQIARVEPNQVGCRGSLGQHERGSDNQSGSLIKGSDYSL